MTRLIDILAFKNFSENFPLVRLPTECHSISVGTWELGDESLLEFKGATVLMDQCQLLALRNIRSGSKETQVPDFTSRRIPDCQ